MCEFCMQHGEGKKWYLQAKNYNQELLNEQRKSVIRATLARGEEDWVKWGTEVDAMSIDPVAVRANASSQRDIPEKGAWGQIVPIEDVERILDMSVNIVRLSCLCRRFIRGVRNARFCFGLNVPEPDVQSFRELPDYSNDFEVLSKENAKQVFRRF